MKGGEIHITENRSAFHDYEILDRYVAGIVLKGTEVKAIMEHKVSIKEAYCIVKNGEIFINKMHVGKYSYGGKNQHEPLRLRKLLLNKNEILKIWNFMRERKGIVIPLRVFVSERGKVKIEIACVKPLKKYDKREKIKEREMRRRARELD